MRATSLLPALLLACVTDTSADARYASETGTMGDYGDTSGGGGGDADTDADSDADSDADGDADSDADSDSDTDADANADSGGGADTAVVEECDSAVSSEQTLYLSADDSNSQASPVIARALIDQGDSYNGHAKSWEYLNYYDFDYTPPEGDELRIDAQLVASDDYADAYELVVAVVSPDWEAETRAALNLVFAVDTSCSMGGTGLTMAQSSMRAIAHELKAGDLISMVNWATNPDVVLDGHAVTGADDADLLAAIDALEAGDSTNLSKGLEAGYRLADGWLGEGRMNRVVLISDGGANTGETDEEVIGEHAAAQEADSVYLIGVGTAEPDNYDGHLMDTVTDLGRGAHVFIDSTSEAQHQFYGERFLQNLGLAASDVKLEMTLPADWVIERFSGEEISTDPKEVVPQNLGPNDQMLYHLTIRNCGGEADPALAFTVAWSDTTGGKHTASASSTVSTMLASGSTQVYKAVALVDAAEAIDTVLDQPPNDRSAWLDAAIDRVEAAAAHVGSDDDLDEVLATLRAYRDLF